MNWNDVIVTRESWTRHPIPSLLVGLFWVLASVGCSPPPGSQTTKPVEEPPKTKAPATSAYGKALEAAEKLKDKAADYNDRLEKLNDPFPK